MANIDTGAIHIGTLLRDSKQYLVPEFQRDYSWESEQIEQLWSDIFDAIDGKSADYFIGSMVINDSNATHYQVIDGQQRLTTISILLCAMRDQAIAKGHLGIASGISSDFLGKLDYSTQETRPKLVLNKNNKTYYSERIVNNADIDQLRSDRLKKSLIKSNRRIASAYVSLYDSIEEKLNKGVSFTDLLSQIVTAVDNMIQVIRISVKDDYDAYLLFETLNDRGLALTVADLLKNYLFSQAEDRLQDVQEHWRQMVQSLDQIETKRFLRHFWLSNYGVVRDKELYKKMRLKYTTKSSVEKLSRDLRDSAEFYSALSDPSHDTWSQFSPESRQRIVDGIEELITFNVNQYNPLLLATLESNPSEFEAVLKLVLAFAFRYSIILGSGTGNIEKNFTIAALHMREKKNASAADVFEKIKHLYPSDADFEDAFRDKSLTQSALARYTLRKLNDHLENSSGSVANKNGFVLNLEHVFPQKPDLTEWSDFSGQEVSEWVYRIGNMTLLSSSLNKKISNSSFLDKLQKGYSTSKSLPISADIFNSTEWTPNSIHARQEKMAKLAVEIWAYP